MAGPGDVHLGATFINPVWPSQLSWGVRRPTTLLPQRMRYVEIEPSSRAQIAAALLSGAPDRIRLALLAASLYDADADWAAALCLQHARHPEPGVRGIALQGLGHIARLHGTGDRARIAPVVLAGLADADPWVRGQAEDAAGDLRTYLGWRLRPNPRQDFADGFAVPGVHLQRESKVEIVEGPHAGRCGVVVSLLEVAPEPCFLVELQSDDPDQSRPVEVAQRHLRPVA